MASLAGVNELTRRRMLSAVLYTAAAQTAGRLSLTGLLIASEQTLAAHHEGVLHSLSTLAVEEAEEFAAIAARILPTDDMPGATEGGVIYFIDAVLGSSRSELLLPMREGLSSLQASAHHKYGSANFSTLTPDQQDELLTSIEKTEFFETLRYLTLAGMFTLPEYGGNRDHLGWDLIGFDHRHAWQPPFGYYDADYAQRGQ